MTLLVAFDETMDPGAAPAIALPVCNTGTEPLALVCLVPPAAPEM